MENSKHAWRAIRILVSMIMMIGIFGCLWMYTEYPITLAIVFLFLFVVTYWGAGWNSIYTVDDYNDEIERLELEHQLLVKQNEILKLQTSIYHDALSSIAYADMSENQMRQVALEEVDHES